MKQKGIKYQDIESFDQHLYNLDNGITLCKDCHSMFHKIYGNKTNNKNQLTIYLAHE